MHTLTPRPVLPPQAYSRVISWRLIGAMCGRSSGRMGQLNAGSSSSSTLVWYKLGPQPQRRCTKIAMAQHRSYLVRNLDDESYLETFLVSGVAAILLLRFYLYMTGFPQVGGKGLHVAHTLWGGVLMLVALAIVFNYLDRDGYRLGALLGGAGFGLFIDELGKFITSDTNYFFRPTAAIIYIIFIVLFLGFRLLGRERNVADWEYLINSVEVFQQAIIRGYDRAYLEKARSYLDRAGSGSPLYGELQRLYDSCLDQAAQRPGRVQRWRERSREM